MENCVFSKIAKGESDTDLLYEDNLVCAFNDISPAANTHILIIPKRPIKNMNFLKNTEEDINLVKHMEEIGKKLIKNYVQNDEYRIGFTQPPFNTVPYLHMHVLSLPITCNYFRSVFLNPKIFLWTPEMIIEKLQKQ